MIHGYKIRIRGVINKYINIFDSSKSSSFIMYLHFDNQYSHALSEPVPYRGYQWLKIYICLLTTFLKKYIKNSEIRYTLVTGVGYLFYLIKITIVCA